MRLCIIHEGIAVNADTRDLMFDFEKDNPGDVIKFFDNTAVVTKLPNNLFVGFAFGEMSPDMMKKQEQTELLSINKALTNFQKNYRTLVERHTVRSLSGPQIEDAQKFQLALSKFAPYNALKKILGNAIDQIIAQDPSNSIKVVRGITELLGEKYDIDLMRQYAKGSTARVDATVTDLKKDYRVAANAIIRQINTGIAGENADIENFMYFAAERLANFDGLGFQPDVLVYPQTGSAMLSDFATMVASEMGISAMEGLRKKDRGISYNMNGTSIPLVDANGNVNPQLSQYDEIWLGRGQTLSKIANSIIRGAFKITHIYPENRPNVEGFMEPLPELREALMHNNALNVLLIDDSIFSGATQRAMMDALKQFNVQHVASYALIMNKV